MDSGDTQIASSVPGDEIEVAPVDQMIEGADVDQGIEPPVVPQFDGMFTRPGFWISVLWCSLLFVVQIAVAIGLVIVALIVVIAQNQGPLDQSKLAGQLQQVAESWMLPVGSFSTVVLAFLVTLALFRTQLSRCMGFRRIAPMHLALVLLLTIPMAVLTSEFTNWVQYVFPNLEMLKVFADFSAQPFVLVFIAGCVFPGLGEELFFRGFLSRGLISRFGPLIGALFASFLFGLIHVHPVQASGALVIGLVLQYVFLTTQSLWGAIALHTANNALAFGMMAHGHRLPIPGLTSGAEDGITHTPALLVMAAVVSAATLMWALYRTRTKWLHPDGTTWSRGFVTAEGPVDPSVEPMAGSIQMQDLVGVGVTYGIFIATMMASVAA